MMIAYPIDLFYQPAKIIALSVDSAHDEDVQGKPDCLLAGKNSNGLGFNIEYFSRFHEPELELRAAKEQGLVCPRTGKFVSARAGLTGG